LNLVGTGSGLDSDSKFEKHDWDWTQKIRVRTPLVHSEEKMRKVNIGFIKKYIELQNTRIYRILFWISEMLQSS